MAIHMWLEKQGITFATEVQSRVAGKTRTPDFLLDKPTKLGGRTVNWVESKASFGDDKEVMRDFNKQLSDYVHHFGPGIVVYAYGFIDGLSVHEKILIADANLLQ